MLTQLFTKLTPTAPNFTAFAGLLVAVLIFSGTTAHADQFGSDTMSFAETVKTLQSQAHSKEMLHTQTVYDFAADNTTGLAADVVQQLQKIAVEQSNIWADTILEGDYEAAGNTRLDRVEIVKLGDDSVAYRITYSEQGWFIGDCNYDYKNRELLNSCQTGRIVESTYVSPTLTSWMRDDRAFAQFQE